MNKDEKTKRPIGTLVTGIVLLLSSALIEALAPRAVAGGLVLGTFGLMFVVFVVAAPLLRGTATARDGWRLIAWGPVLMLVSGALSALPPHSILFAILLLLVGVGCFMVGTAIIGGGYFSLVGAAGAGAICAAIMMAPTPIALATMNHTENCAIPAARYGHTSDEFDVHCPNGKVYPITTNKAHTTGVPVRMLVDPHGLLKPEIADRVHVHKDELALVLSLLFGAATVVAAQINRRRRGGRVRPVYVPNPGQSA